MTTAIVPAKDLRNAKKRLSALLSPQERSSLYRAMLGDVLEALSTASGIHELIVVTGDPDLTELAREFAAEVCSDPENLGHTQAVRLGIEHALGRAARAVMTVPGDVPSVTPDEIERMVTELEPGNSALFVPSRSGLGTNGVLLQPPDSMPLRFGEPSFPDHLATADRLGIGRQILNLPGLSLDVDTPSDLAELLTRKTGERTRRMLDALERRGVFEAQTSHAR